MMDNASSKIVIKSDDKLYEVHETQNIDQDLNNTQNIDSNLMDNNKLDSKHSTQKLNVEMDKVMTDSYFKDVLQENELSAIKN